MPFSTKYKVFVIIFTLITATSVSYFSVARRSLSPSPPSITTATGNYGLFIDNQDNNYFSTTDANVKNIIQAYLTREDEFPYEITVAQSYGYSIVYYYTKDIFISAELFDWGDRNSLSGFSMHDMKTGEIISDCTIYTSAGLYKDHNLLLSASFTDNGIVMKQGVCLYERGAANFTFIDLSSKLTETETFFNDPAGRNLNASIKNVDMRKRTLAVDVFDVEKKDAAGNYAYRRSLEVSY